MKEKQTKTSLSPRLRKPLRDFYASNFDSPTAGAEFGLEAFRFIIRKLLKGLEGKFSKDELAMVIEVYSDLVLSSNHFGEHIISDMNDAIGFEWVDNAKRLRGVELVKKLETLGTLELGALGVWARAYWVRKTQSGQDDSITLVQYISALVPPEDNQ